MLKWGICVFGKLFTPPRSKQAARPKISHSKDPVLGAGLVPGVEDPSEDITEFKNKVKRCVKGDNKDEKQQQELVDMYNH